MKLSRFLRAVMGTAARRPLAVGLAVGLLAIAGGLLALRLTPTAATDTLVGKGTPSYQATQRFHDRFGDDAVYVLVREPVTKLTLTSDILRMIGLEGCLSGNAPAGQVPPGGAHGPCARLAATKPVKVVFGPGTFLNTAVGQIADEFNAQQQRSAAQATSAANAARQLAKAKGMSKAQQDKVAQQARSLVQNEFAKTVIQLALKYGLQSTPQLNDPRFVSRIVFDDTKPPGTPKGRFAYIFPNKDNALVQVRLRSDLTEAQRADAIRQVRRAVAMPDWKLPNGKGTYAVTGAPVVVNDLTSSITGSVARLLIAALVVMALTLGVVFRSRRRLLPLFVALAAAGLTFGGLSLVGASLTMASIGVLPVLIGLAVDYAIQLQSRVEEEGGSREAVARTATRGAPTVATAAAASAAGFLVLLLSPVPMVRGFGVLLVAGIALAFGCAITLGIAALVATRRAGARPAPAAVRGAGDLLAIAWRGAGDLIADNRPARAVRRRAGAIGRGALTAATVRPGRVLAVAFGVAVLGWGLDTQTHVESDIQKLVPQNLPALADLQALQKSTGVGGELDVVVDGDLTDPAVVSWMARYQKSILAHYRYSARRGCGTAEVCPAFSLPDLLGSSTTRASRKQIQALLDAVPPYFSQGVITGDHRTATLAFGIRLMPLDRQQRVIEEMRRRLHPPPGVRAELAGLPVLAAEANARVSSPWRRLITLLAGLLAVALVLLVAFRRWQRAVVPLVPIALATGWSALVLFLLRIPLNPMSVTLGALVIAISTEFSVLLSERFRSERLAGHEPGEALARTYRSTGAAVLASGTTAIAGFAVLMVSDIRMLRDFGFVTVVDLTVALAGVMVVLPAVLVLAERRGLLAARTPAGRRRLRLPRRRGRVERAPAA